MCCGEYPAFLIVGMSKHISRNDKRRRGKPTLAVGAAASAAVAGVGAGVVDGSTGFGEIPSARVPLCVRCSAACAIAARTFSRLSVARPPEAEFGTGGMPLARPGGVRECGGNTTSVTVLALGFPRTLIDRPIAELTYWGTAGPELL